MAALLAPLTLKTSERYCDTVNVADVSERDVLDPNAASRYVKLSLSGPPQLEEPIAGSFKLLFVVVVMFRWPF